MGADSKIEWTTHTFNPWVGCTPVSPACDHCYAESWAKRTGQPELWKGERRRTSAANWRQPLKWDRAAAAAGERHRVFCASLADVFDNQVPEQWRADLWALIAETPHLDWLLLTKRPQNIVKMLPSTTLEATIGGRLWPWPNVWLGTTVENQEEAERRIPHLLAVPAAVRFLSCEPLLGPVDLRLLRYDSGDKLPPSMRVNDERCSVDALRGVSTWPNSHYQSPVIARKTAFLAGDFYESRGDARRLDWIICGGESGPKARPMHPAWARNLRDQCTAAGVPFFFKQWGEWAPAPEIIEARGSSFHQFEKGGYLQRVGKKNAGRLLDGCEHNNSPRAA